MTNNPDITELRSWLIQLGTPQNADEKIEIEGIMQRLSQLADPRIEYERYGRLMSECARFKDKIIGRRDVLPKYLIGENVTNAHESRDDYADKQDFIHLVQQLNGKLKPPPRTFKDWMNLKQLKTFQNKYSGRDTLRNWLKEALPDSLNKSGRPRKHTVIPSR